MKYIGQRAAVLRGLVFLIGAVIVSFGGKGVGAAQADAILETVVARVEDRPIFAREWQAELDRVKAHYHQEKTKYRQLQQLLKMGRFDTLPPAWHHFKELTPAQLSQKALANLIRRQIIITKAQAAGLKVSTPELYQGLINTYLMEKGGLKGGIPDSVSGFSAQQQRSQHFQILYNKFINKVLARKLPVTIAAQRKYYQENAGLWRHNGDVKIAHIYFYKPLAKATSKPEASKKLANLQKKIRDIAKQINQAPKNQRLGQFQKKARKYNQDPFAQSQGHVGWVGQKYGALRLKLLKYGHLGFNYRIWSSRRGFHLIWILEFRPAGKYTYEQMAGKIQKQLFTQKVQAWAHKVRSQFNIKLYYKELP